MSKDLPNAMRPLRPFFALTGMVAVPDGALAAAPAAWLLAPLSGAAQHHIADWAAWHARWMVLGWGVLLPLGVLAARFFKVLPGQPWPQRLDHKAWWHAHRLLQWAGVLAMLAGLWLAWGQGSGATAAARAHALLGHALCAAGLVQLISGLLRGSKGGPTEPHPRGDHYDMTGWRLRFERLHKALGWAAVLVAAGVIVLGLVVADAPRWMLLVLAAWWGLLAMAFVRWQRQGRCIDTYQAIWGPDAAHPGNRRSPVGWGVRRYTAAQWRARFERR